MSWLKFLHAVQFLMLLWSAADFYQLHYSKNYFRNIIRVSNSLNPDQDLQSVSPDLGPNCLQKLSDSRRYVATSKVRVKSMSTRVIY